MRVQVSKTTGRANVSRHDANLVAQTGIDHLIFVSTNLEATRTEFEELGFVTSPRNEHPHFGTANYLVVFEDCYFELIGMVNDDPEDRFAIDMFAAQLRRGGDMHVFALRTRDIVADRDILAQRGFELPEASTWKRGALLNDGSLPTASFSTLGIPADATPGAGFLYCEHHTPELIWRPEWKCHENRAMRLIGVSKPLLGGADTAAACHAKLFGDAAIEKSKDGITVNLGGGQSLMLLRDATETVVSLAGKSDHEKKFALETIPSVSIKFRAACRSPGDPKISEPD